MKVLAISSYPPPFIGGSRVYIYNLISQCPQKIDILTQKLNDNDIEHKKHNGKLIRKIFFYYGTKLTNTRRIKMLLSLIFFYPYILLKNKYDIVIVSTEVLWNCFFILYSKLFNVKVVGVAYAEEITMSLKGTTLNHRLKGFLIRKIYKLADGFISVCDFTKDLLINLKIKDNDICVIAPMLSIEKVNKRDDTPIFKNGVLSVGRLIKRKGFDLLIEAINRLKDEIPDIKLKIIGNGPEKKQLLKQIKKLKLSNHIKIVSNTSDVELSECYRQNELFVLANIMCSNGDCEGTPTVLIEACSYEKPVIAGIEGGTSSIVNDGINGFLVDPKNTELLAQKIKNLLIEKEMAKKLGIAGRLKVQEDHNPKISGKKFYKFLESIYID